MPVGLEAVAVVESSVEVEAVASSSHMVLVLGDLDWVG